jgi:alkylation response protein AidB-like acyl-CoA dehydrogenase
VTRMTITAAKEESEIRPVISALRRGGDEAIVYTAERVAERIAGRAERYDRTGEYPRESIQEIWGAGLAALTIPAELGGVGASVATTARSIEILSRADSATTLVFVWGFGQHRILNAPGSKWPEHWRRRLAKDALDGPALVNALRVEPDLGTPARGGLPASVATRFIDHDGSEAWCVKGHKIYCTGSYGLKWLPVWVSTEEGDNKAPRVGTVLVPAEAPGVQIIPTWDHIGMRASVGHDIVFDNVVVPIGNAIDLKTFTGSDAAMSLRDDPLGILATANLLSLAVYTGVAKAARDRLVALARGPEGAESKQALSMTSGFVPAIGEIEALIYDNERLLFGLASQIDSRVAAQGATGDKAPHQQTSFAISESSVVKHLVSLNVIKVTGIAMSLVAASGLSHDRAIERHHRDALCSRVHTPQSDVVLGSIGKVSLGLAR